MEYGPLVSRRYPLEHSTDESAESFQPSGRSWLKEDGLSIRLARVTASALLAVIEWRRAHLDLSQTIGTILLLAFGVGLAGSAGLIDEYLHRGVEDGVEPPYIVQPAGKELATNVNLVPYAGQGLVDIVDALAGSGFRYVRQQFTWAEIEPSAGTRDWSSHDDLVNQLNRREIQVIAVIVDAPEWSLVADPTSPESSMVVDPVAFSGFTQELTSRFGNAVPYVQIWDRPNLADATPAGAITPSAFVQLLAAGANGAREGRAEVKIVLPELAIVPDTPDGKSDLDYLSEIYSAEGAPFFDIVAISLDGTTFSPDDRRVSASRENLSRAILVREVMQDNDDRDSPVWATSFGWATTESLSRETQAEFVSRGLTRSWAEWPWMGLMVQWQFLADSGSPDAPYSIVLPDGSATPLYDRLVTQSTRNESNIAHTGFAPMDSAAVSYQGNWQDQHLEGRTFKTTSQVGSSMTINFSGTGAVAFMRSGPRVGEFELVLDGEIIPGGAGEDGARWDFWWHETTDLPRSLLSGLDDTAHTLTITLVDEGDLTLGGMVVAREAPFTWPIMLMSAASFLSLFLAMRSFIYLVAVRAGHLVRSGTLRNPQLPLMPNWRPSRRV